MTNDTRNISRGSIGRLESEFLAQVGPLGIFTLEDAARILGPNQREHARQFIERLRRKGWIERIRPGVYAAIPLSSSDDRTPQLHEYLVAMSLVQPAAISFFSAMNHHGLTEQLPREVYVTTDHKVSKRIREALGFSFRIVCLQPKRWFGLRQEWIDERPFLITDPEKTLVDGLSLPAYVGGVGTIVEALRSSWSRLDEARLYDYAHRLGAGAVLKRLGFILESLGIGAPDKLRPASGLPTGYPSLDPTLPARGAHNQRWKLLVNAEVGR